MNRIAFIILLLLSFTIMSVHISFDNASGTEPYPNNWPQPHYQFENNPITEEGFELGRALFYDPNLSRDNTISCASCHLQYTGFAHVDHNVSHGIEGRKGTRNAPALINLAWNESFHWDGGVNHIEVQAINPIQHPAEMDNSLDSVLTYLNASVEYQTMFYAAFGDSIATTKNFLYALTQFTGSLISSNSRFDQFQRGEVQFTEQELNGYEIFQKHCNSCHTEPLFNSNRFASNGLPVDTAYNDVGRYQITHIPSDSMKFKVPTLRNIAYTFPYMHDGRFKKLKEVVNYYVNEINIDDPHLSPELKKRINISDDGQKDLIAFLNTLTDKEFLFNPKFSFPK